jgi:hypothetical protein
MTKYCCAPIAGGKQTSIRGADGINCTDRVPPSVHARLTQDFLEATTELDAVKAIHNQIMGDIPSGLPHPDGAQRIHSIAQQLSSANRKVNRAHSRLTDFLDKGIVPKELK